MELDFRIWILLGGTAVVGYVVFDSWRNRRRNGYRFKLDKNIPQETPEVGVDRTGFDTFGVGKARVRSLEEDEAQDRETENDVAADAHREPHFGDSAVPTLTRSAAASSTWASEPATLEPAETSADTVRESTVDVWPAPAQSAAQAGTAFSEREPEMSASPAPSGRTGDLFGDAPSKPARERRSPKRDESRRGESASASTDIEVIALTVLAKPGKTFSGAALQAAFMEHDLRFGDMSIFHRHSGAAGQGEVLFSLANAVKPGIFDADQMERFSTPGVSLFMTMPGPQDTRLAYTTLVRTAEGLASALDGEVHDGARKPFNVDVRRKHQDQLAEYERRHAADL